MLLMLTMLPWPRAAIPGAKAATRANGARTLLANILSNAETSNPAVGPKAEIPALLIRMSTSPTSPASLSFTTSRFGGSNPAQPGVDFVETSGILRFAAGQRTAFINVTTIGDNTREATERVIVRLSNPLNLQFPATISGTPGLFLHGDLVNND